MATRSFSIEDGNLSSSIVVSRDIDYKDIDLTFAINGKKDIYKKNDAAAVKQAVKNLILTNYGEKPFNYYYGSNVQSLLFELFHVGISLEIETKIKSAINAFEPRAYVEDVKVKDAPAQNAIEVQIVFRVLNTQDQVTLVTTLSRLR